MPPRRKPQENRAPAGEHEYARRCDAAVNDALGVQRLERREKALNNHSRLRWRQASAGALHILGERLALVMSHHQVRRSMRLHETRRVHEVRMRDVGEQSSLVHEASQRPHECSLVLLRVRPHARAVDVATDEAAGEELLQHSRGAIRLIVRQVRDRERARLADRPHEAIAIGEQRTCRKR